MKQKMLTAAEWGAKLSPPISRRRASKLCEEERVEGAVLVGIPPRETYQVPEGAKDPRKKAGRPRRKKP